MGNKLSVTIVIYKSADYLKQVRGRSASTILPQNLFLSLNEQYIENLDRGSCHHQHKVSYQ
jgi:hypothetical protein